MDMEKDKKCWIYDPYLKARCKKPGVIEMEFYVPLSTGNLVCKTFKVYRSKF